MRLSGIAWLAFFPALAASQGPPAYEIRGRGVEASRQAMQARIQVLRSNLVDSLKGAAPDLVARIDPAPPPVPQGYQLLPRLVAELPQPADTTRRAALYSWPWTDTLIARGITRIDSLERSLARPGKARGDYERFVATFNGIAADRRLIDAHVEHNWFWQRAIARDTAHFQRASRLIDSALRGRGAIPLPAPSMPRVEMSLLDSGAGPVIVRIPVVTDIEDTAFVRSAQAIIERLWIGRAQGREHRIQLEVRFVSPRSLYCPGAAPACAPPARGAAIDLTSHVARFPANLAVLTTGGTQPHVLFGRSMILGPRDLTPRTLAHEFGHVLGFDDAYLRGARALGADGYAVIELIPDRADIMASSGIGDAQARHFEQLVANLRADRAMRSGLAAMYERNDPRSAVVSFREVLGNRPDHYGAIFQLAKALDQTGDSVTARPQWLRMLDLARAQGDSATLAVVKRRLGIP